MIYGGSENRAKSDALQHRYSFFALTPPLAAPASTRKLPQFSVIPRARGAENANDDPSRQMPAIPCGGNRTPLFARLRSLLRRKTLPVPPPGKSPATPYYAIQNSRRSKPFRKTFRYSGANGTKSATGSGHKCKLQPRF